MESNPKVIEFYGKKHEYGEFSNFWNFEIEIDEIKYPTTEHYFQAMKFETSDKVYMDKIIQAPDPMTAKRMGKDRHKPMRTDWQLVKDDIMYIAIKAKFTQSDSLRKLLLSTGDALLVEAAPNDYYWGSGKDGTGKNMLGKLLVKLREEIKN